MLSNKDGSPLTLTEVVQCCTYGIHVSCVRCLSGDCVSASRHLSASVSTTEAIYGSSSIELANELMKYAEVCAVAGLTQAARSAAERARSLFELNYGVDCDAVSELTELLDKLTLGNLPASTNECTIDQELTEAAAL